jgi:hypothetical protein
MKWFRHDAHCSKDAKLDKLLMKYGAEGYGLYWYCVEIIAGEVSADNTTFELEHDAEILSYRLKLDKEKVVGILSYCVGTGLFEINPETKTLSVWRSQNAQTNTLLRIQKLLKYNIS